MDADPPNNFCEKAKKQFTATLLNVCSDRLPLGCPTELGEEGCASETVGDLVIEIAGLILDGACKTANSCAAAVNESGMPDGGGGRRTGLKARRQRQEHPGQPTSNRHLERK